MPEIEHVDLSYRVYETLKAIEQGNGALAEQRLKSHLHLSRNAIAESLVADHRSAG